MTIQKLNIAEKLKIAVAGSSGRMGKMLIDAINASDDCELAGQLDIGIDIHAELQNADYLIDFTRPEGTMAHIKVCQELNVKMVIGTTGFSDAEKATIAAASKNIAIMLAPNMSVGVNVTLKLLEMAAKAMSTGYDIEIIETHHRHKVDAPSGTALKMGEVISDALGRDLKGHAVFAREGITGARDPQAIGFSAIRGGDIVGDHTVMFAGTGERIEITHKSSNREGYALGALRAVRYLATQKTGLFDMFDVLGLK
jgi:4-hydroxy-tetrahydrodipicolinate reductase